ncbi:hypothetical protein JYU34_006676 [Plutella xylostella]|uniref:Uncharacterized protein n=1 Tax=Plutella xylostella TaxID=51655 RepID=A0ABQ7QSN3_PLUXY|nr:hypothetical protein JYU34_006676 [Plutella xylostella]
MSIRFIIAGESQCQLFAQACLVADYLAQNLPNIRYDTIQKPILEWKPWLCKINMKNNWHHCSSPLIWKELLMKGSKPYYIGSATQFWDYCYSYYKLETFITCDKLRELIPNIEQFKQEIEIETKALKCGEVHEEIESNITVPKNNFVVCISGAEMNIVKHLIFNLLEMIVEEKNISEIYIYDIKNSKSYMKYIERELSCFKNNPKTLKYAEKIGFALTHADLLIVLDHAPYDDEDSIGFWLHANRRIMENLAHMINPCAPSSMKILFPNIGPSCYNATVLANAMIRIPKWNIVVATSDLGMEMAPVAAEIAEVPHRNMFCPPVWGFVGINHLIDIRTTIHRYNSFDPYSRFLKVQDSTLKIGSLKPQLRTMEYLMAFDESLWIKVAERKHKIPEGQIGINKAEAVLNVVKLWLLEEDPENYTNLGIRCDGTFGLTFDGVFSQPAHLINGVWQPVRDYMTPKDPHMKLPYLQYIAELSMKFQEKDLPKIYNICPCDCTGHTSLCWKS